MDPMMPRRKKTQSFETKIIQFTGKTPRRVFPGEGINPNE